MAGTLLAPAGAALAAPGDLDPTFGSGGRVTVPLGRLGTPAFSLIQQSDGRLVVATTISDASGSHRVLARLETNGSLDPSFGDGGIAVGPADQRATAVIQQPDGELVVAGTAWSGGYDIALWRFDPSGSADPGFGNAGTASLDLGGIEGAAGLVQQADGKLVIVGAIASALGDRRLTFARFNANGSLDTTFGSGGIASVDTADDRSFNLTSFLRQPDGKLLVTGNVAPGLALIRLSADGTPDQTFGVHGTVDIAAEVLDEEHTHTQSGAAALQDDGRIVVVGIAGHFVCCDPWGDPIGTRNGFVLRLEPDGDLDPRFATRGFVNHPAHMHAVAIQSDGRIVVAAGDYPFYMGLMRFNADGRIDDRFGIAGSAVADFGERNYVNLSDALIIQSDGNFVLAGGATEQGEWILGMARFGAETTGFAGLIGLTSAYGYAAENHGPATLGVRRTGGATGEVSVTFETFDGSATAGSDYEPRTGRLTWADGDTSNKTITLPLIGDGEDEPTSSEDFHVRLMDPTGGSMLTASTARVIIDDDDDDPPAEDDDDDAGGGGPLDAGGGGSSSDGYMLALLLLGLAGRRATRSATHPARC